MSIKIAVNLLRRYQRQIFKQLTVGWMTIAIALSLSGCVNYQAGINFYSLNHGEIIEQIQLDDRLQSFSQTAVSTWLESIEQRTKQAQGRIERQSDRELTVIIPFYNPHDLTTKIDRYFQSPISPTSTRPQFNSHLQIHQNNFFVVVRNHLTYDLDLRALATTKNNQKVPVPVKNSVKLDLSIRSPWGVKTDRTASNTISTASDDRQVTWQLQPGSLNHIDAIFWLPNPLAIGSIAIVFFGMFGYYLKYRQLPWQQGVNS